MDPVDVGRRPFNLKDLVMGAVVTYRDPETASGLGSGAVVAGPQIIDGVLYVPVLTRDRGVITIYVHEANVLSVTA